MTARFITGIYSLNRRNFSFRIFKRLFRRGTINVINIVRLSESAVNPPECAGVILVPVIWT